MRHHLSYQLRTMLRHVDRKILDEAADELDRLNNLIVETVAQSSARHAEYQRQLTLRDTKIRELERTLQKAPLPPTKDSPA